MDESRRQVIVFEPRRKIGQIVATMRNRKTRAALIAAFLPMNPFAARFLNDGGDAGGGTDDADEKKKAAGKSGAGAGKKKESEGGDAGGDDAGGKITISEADLKARTEKAVADALAAHEKKLKAEREKADREQKKKDGDVTALYESEQARAKELETEAAALRMENKKLSVAAALKDHLIEAQPDYAASARYILPLIEFTPDTKPEEIEKAVKNAVAQFVKDNPREKKSTNGAPGSGVRGKSTAAETTPQEKPDPTKRATNPRDTPAGAYLRSW